LSEKACEVEKCDIIRPTCKLQLQKGLQHWPTDAAVEGTFVWNSTRNVTTYTKWKGGQPGPNDIKNFTALFYKCSKQARVFIPGKPLQVHTVEWSSSKAV
jgi:hypothetical protein